jgi:hypothetical protein
MGEQGTNVRENEVHEDDMQEMKTLDEEMPGQKTTKNETPEKEVRDTEVQEIELHEHEHEQGVQGEEVHEKPLQMMTTTRKPYISTQLQDPLSIRIAILSPGLVNDTPSISLEVRNLSEPDLNYEAISYCWSQGLGNTIEDKWDFEVKCGEDIFMVPKISSWCRRILDAH